MSQLDVLEAKRALAHRLREWGIEDDAYMNAAGFIDDLVRRGWQMDPKRENRPQPPKPNAACRTCGQRLEQ